METGRRYSYNFPQQRHCVLPVTTTWNQYFKHPNDTISQTSAQRYQGSRQHYFKAHYRQPSSSNGRCDKCGKWVYHGFQDHNLTCTAKSAKCYRCGKFGHFSRACLNKRIFGIKSEAITHSKESSKTKSAYRKARDAKRLEEFLKRKNLTNALPFLELLDDDFIKTNKRNHFVTHIANKEVNTHSQTKTELTQLASRNTQLVNEIQTLHIQIEKLNAQLQEEKKGNALFSELLEMNNTDKVQTYLKHQKEVSDLTSENSNLKFKILQLESQLSQISDLQEENENLLGQIEQLEMHIECTESTFTQPTPQFPSNSYAHPAQQTTQYPQQQYFQPQQHTHQNRRHRRNGRQNFRY